MSNTHAYSPHSPLSLREILQRTAVPFLLFTVVLAVLLILSWMLILPIVTQVEIAGAVRSTDDLQVYSEGLQENVRTLEKQRDTFVLPMNDELYGSLKERKEGEALLLVYRDAIYQLASSLVPEQADVVSLSVIRYSNHDNVIEVVGDVRNVGPRSMTVLAQLTEVLRRLPFVMSVENPRFVREEDPEIGFHSPFTLQLYIQ